MAADAPKLSLPGKLVFPSVSDSSHFSMLGLGDIVSTFISGYSICLHSTLPRVYTCFYGMVVYVLLFCSLYVKLCVIYFPYVLSYYVSWSDVFVKMKVFCDQVQWSLWMVPHCLPLLLPDTHPLPDTGNIIPYRHNLYSVSTASTCNHCRCFPRWCRGCCYALYYATTRTNGGKPFWMTLLPVYPTARESPTFTALLSATS